jgi:co-chaperonin GroES (HSP10)
MELDPQNVIPQFDRILVKVDAAETKTESGLYLAKPQDSKFRKGIVQSVGPGKRLDNGKFAKMSVEPDQEVIFGAYAGIEIDDKNGLVLISEEEIYAVTKKTEV